MSPHIVQLRTPDLYRLFASSTVLYLNRFCTNGWYWNFAGLGAVGRFVGAARAVEEDMDRVHCRDVALDMAWKAARAAVAGWDMVDWFVDKWM